MKKSNRTKSQNVGHHVYKGEVNLARKLINKPSANISPNDVKLEADDTIAEYAANHSKVTNPRQVYFLKHRERVPVPTYDEAIHRAERTAKLLERFEPTKYDPAITMDQRAQRIIDEAIRSNACKYAADKVCFCDETAAETIVNTETTDNFHRWLEPDELADIIKTAFTPV